MRLETKKEEMQGASRANVDPLLKNHGDYMFKQKALSRKTKNRK